MRRLKDQARIRKDEPMSIETTMTSDVVGLTKVAPVSRRGFMSATAAVAAGYTLAAGPVRAKAITTTGAARPID